MNPQALFLDRDGTLVEEVNYLCKPEEVRLVPRLRESLQVALEAGCRLFLFTNQSGVGRGYFTMEDVLACNGRLEELVGLRRPLFDGVCIAPERPDEPSVYRKPSPAFIEEMVAKFGLDRKRCWMLGDRMSDWMAGVNAGIHVAAVRTGLPLKAQDEAFLLQRNIPLYGHFAEFVDAQFSATESVAGKAGA